VESLQIFAMIGVTSWGCGYSLSVSLKHGDLELPFAQALMDRMHVNRIVWRSKLELGNQDLNSLKKLV